jgi:hypothetical protein
MYDGAGSLFALGTRLTKLDTVGAPLVGANNCYVTDALVTVGIGLEYEDGNEIIQRNGSGRICLTFRAPDTLKRGTIADLSVCSPDPNVLEFAMGGNVISTGGAGTAEVQTVTLTGVPTGGDFTLTLDGETTGDIVYNAAASAVEIALEALPGVGSGNVTVTGSAGGPYSVTFSIAMGNVPQMTADGSGLTGGTAPNVTVVTATPGDNLTDIGYAAPEVGVEANPNGLGIEFWSRAIDQGAYAANLPYFHWVLPRANVRPSDAWTLSGEDPLLPSFEGFCTQNPSWGTGPTEDWPYQSDRVWQFARVATLPDLTPGFVAVA